MYDVVLLKMTGCHYCDKFSPIYNKASSLNNNNKINFEEFDMENPEEKAIFEEKYNDIAKKEIEGYPTVFLKDDKNIKEIETVIDDNIAISAKKFLNNVKNTLGVECKADDEYKILTEKYDKLFDDFTKIKYKYNKYKIKYLNKKNKK